MIEHGPFGVTRSGEAVERLTLRAGALEVELLTFGGTIRAFRAPDRNGDTVDIVLGYDTLAGYESNGGYLGALVGRYANRVAGASCLIDGQRVPLEANEGAKQLHGGKRGFSYRVFDWEAAGDSAVTLTYRSPDGEGGWPGNLTLRATYALLPDRLSLRYEAVCDKATYCSITNHSYFNLNGGGDVLGHRLTLFADHFTPIDGESIPTALAAPVEGTPFDFRREKAIGLDIAADHPQLLLARGYDHNFLLSPGQGLRPAARLVGETSGIALECWTEKPGVQVYTANFLATDASAKGGVPYGPRGGVALETQFAPDSPNHPEWGDILLRPGRRYDYSTQFRVGVL